MNLVIDANILFAILIKSGKTEELILHKEIFLFAPEFLFEEFEKYSKLIADKTSRNKQELQKNNINSKEKDKNYF
jgi:predicted nucleic acid-binding protein